MLEGEGVPALRQFLLPCAQRLVKTSAVIELVKNR
jgi:hypothetical protein